MYVLIKPANCFTRILIPIGSYRYKYRHLFPTKLTKLTNPQLVYGIPAKFTSVLFFLCRVCCLLMFAQCRSFIFARLCVCLYVYSWLCYGVWCLCCFRPHTSNTRTVNKKHACTSTRTQFTQPNSSHPTNAPDNIISNRDPRINCKTYQVNMYVMYWRTTAADNCCACLYKGTRSGVLVWAQNRAHRRRCRHEAHQHVRMHILLYEYTVCVCS